MSLILIMSLTKENLVNDYLYIEYGYLMVSRPLLDSFSEQHTFGLLPDKIKLIKWILLVLC